MRRLNTRYIWRPDLLVLALGILIVHLMWTTRPAGADTLFYTYDSQGQLTAANDVAAGIIQQYTYDPIGNRQTASVTHAAAPCQDSTICNGDFEAGLEYWTASQAVAALTEGRSGSGARVTVNGTSGDLSQVLPGRFSAGQSYLVTAWFLADAGVSASLTVSALGGASEPDASVSASLAGNGTWQRLLVTLTVPLSEGRLRVILGAQTEQGAVVFDDAAIQAFTPSFLLWTQ